MLKYGNSAVQSGIEFTTTNLNIIDGSFCMEICSNWLKSNFGRFHVEKRVHLSSTEPSKSVFLRK